MRQPFASLCRRFELPLLYRGADREGEPGVSLIGKIPLTLLSWRDGVGPVRSLVRPIDPAVGGHAPFAQRQPRREGVAPVRRHHLYPVVTGRQLQVSKQIAARSQPTRRVVASIIDPAEADSLARVAGQVQR